jgi:hypothetical protein
MGWRDVANAGVSRDYGILDWWGMAWTGDTIASDLLRRSIRSAGNHRSCSIRLIFPAAERITTTYLSVA